MQQEAPHQTRVREDLLVVGSRRLMYVGLILLPMVRLKVTHGLNDSDAVLVGAAGLLLLSRRPPKRAPSTPAWYFGAFVMILAGVVASTQAISRGGSLLVVGNAVYVFIVLQWLLRQHTDTSQRMRLAISAYVLGASISGFVAIMQTTFHIFVPHGLISSSVGGSTRSIGLANQPNIAAVTFAIGVIFGLGLLLELGVRRHPYLVTCVAVLVAALLFCASVSGISATLIGAIVLFVVRGVPLRKVLGIAIVVGLVYVLIFAIFPSGSHLDPLTRLHQTTTQRSGDDTLQIRLDTIYNAWHGVEASPIIGHGLDQATIANYYYYYLRVFYPAHDIVVLFWYAGGIFFVAGAAIMMGSSFNRLLSGRLRHRNRRDPMRDVVLAACVTVLFYSLQGPELVDRWLWLPFILALCFRSEGWDPMTQGLGSTTR